MSEAPSWIGRLPAGWATMPLKRLTVRASRGLSPEYAAEGIPVVNQACVQWSGLRPEAAKKHSAHKSLPEKARLHDGDVLINATGTGTLGRALVFRAPTSETWAADSHIMIVRAGPELEPRFLGYVLRTETYQGFILSVLSAGATNQIELSREGLRRMPIPHTLVGQQRTIADFLDRKTAAIDVLIEKKERLVALLQEKRQALITQAVTKGLDPAVSMKDSGVEWLGRIPTHWVMKRLRHISPQQSVGVVVNPSTYFDDNGTIPFLLGSNIRERRIDADGARRVTPASNRHLSKSMLRSGDLVTVRVGAPGVTAVISPALDGCNCASVMFIRRHAEFDSDWLSFAMNSRVGRYQVELVQYGAAQKQFNIGHAVNFVFPVPPLVEQRAISLALGLAEDRAASLIERVGHQIERLREYRTALITAAVTGQLDVSAEAP